MTSRRIVQVANFVTPTSGGLRTTLRHLADGYVAAGYDVVQVVPGSSHTVQRSGGVTRIELAAPSIPGAGYRMMVDIARVRRELERIAPDAIEVHDRTTLRGLGSWASAAGIPSCVISHERLDRWVAQWLPRPLRPYQAVASSNASLARTFDRVVCTTEWAAEEFDRIGAGNVSIIPLGVDTNEFRPRFDPRSGDELRLILTSRLSREKRPDLAVTATRELVRRGHRVRLTVCGDGPMQRKLRAEARDLPIEWLGYVGDRATLRSVMADADVALAPGPIETFGLAALEAMACGTPTVVHWKSALPTLVGMAGRSAPGSGWCFADQVEELLTVDEGTRRRAARRQAERYDWQDTVDGFLAVHGFHRDRVAA